VLGEPIDLKAGVELPQLARDREIAPAMAEADRRRQVERALGGPANRLGSRRRRGGNAAQAIDELHDQKVDLGRDAPFGTVPRAGDLDEFAAAKLCQETATLDRLDLVLGPVDQQHRTGQLSIDLLVGTTTAAAIAQHRIDQDLGRGFERPGHGILDLLGRMRLAEAAAQELFREIAVVTLPVRRIPLVVALESHALAEKLVVVPFDALRSDRRRGSDEDEPADPLRAAMGHQRRDFAAQRVADDDGPVGSGRVHDGDRIADVVVPAVVLGARRPVGFAAAAAIEGDHAIVPGQGRDLPLPFAAVDDLPGRQEKNRRLAAAVDFVVQFHVAIPRSSLLVGIPRARHDLPPVVASRPPDRSAGCSADAFRDLVDEVLGSG
jgi:hypothetical protein